MALRISSNPLKYFYPHTKNCTGDCSKASIAFETYDGKKHTIRGCPQYKFFSLEVDTKAYFGGNRSGKTTAGVVEMLMHATGQYPDWWPGRRYKRPIVGRIFASDFSKGLRVVTKKIKEWLPALALVNVYRNNQKAEVEWELRHVSGGVSHLDCMTYEQDSSMAEGWNGDVVLFDEPPPRNTYIATVRGLIDNDGMCMFTLTPLKEPWLFDEIYNSKDQNVASVLCDLRHNLERWNPFSQTLIGLKEEAIRKFEMRLTEEERETRMHGKFRYLAGRIWKEWDREIHTYDRGYWLEGKDNCAVDGQPPSHWPRMMLIDPHDRNPHALLWIALDDTGNYWAYREGWLSSCLISEATAFIKKVETESRERIARRVMDPNFGPKKYANKGLTVRDEFESEGRAINYPIRFEFGDDRKEMGRKEFARLLKYDQHQPISFMNHPKIRFAKDMKESIYQIEHYVWDEFKGSMDRDPKEQPKDMNTHFPDCCHYFALSKFTWHKPQVKAGKGNPYE